MGKPCSTDAVVCGSQGSNTVKVGNVCFCSDVQCEQGSVPTKDNKACVPNFITDSRTSGPVTVKNLPNALQVQYPDPASTGGVQTLTLPDLQAVSLGGA
jgi:hypothetical protein